MKTFQKADDVLFLAFSSVLIAPHNIGDKL